MHKNYIEVPEDKLIDLVIGAYDRSRPVGYGFLQPHEEALTREEATAIIHKGQRSAVHMDYIKGRCCKFNVTFENGKYWVAADYWYDHHFHDLEELLKSVGLKAIRTEESNRPIRY